MEYLLFDLIQNFHGEYPKFSPYMVIKLAEKGKERGRKTAVGRAENPRVEYTGYAFNQKWQEQLSDIG